MQTDWGAEFPGYSVRISAMTALMCMVLTRETFQHVVATYPAIVQVHIKIKMIKSTFQHVIATYPSIVQVHIKIQKKIQFSARHCPLALYC
jgi:hypothetical protein